MHDIKYAYYNTSKGFRVVGGTAAQFLKADGSVDNTSYVNKAGDTMTGSLVLNNQSTTTIVRDLSTITSATGFARDMFRLNGSNGIADVMGWQGSVNGSGSVTMGYGYLGGTAYNSKSAMRWTNDQRVGIGLSGTSQPLAGYALHVSGDSFTFGNIVVSGNINTSAGEMTLQRLGVNRIRTNATSLILSGDTSAGLIYLRPQGDASTAGQVVINSVGSISTATHNTSLEWSLAYNRGFMYRSILNAASNLNDISDSGWYVNSANANATSDNNYPVALAGTLKVFGVNSVHITQEYHTYSTSNDIYRRYCYQGNWSNWVKLWDSNDFSLSNYYTKNEALNTFVGKTGVESISGTKTFTESPIVPNATLNGHAVNFGQMDWLLGQTVSNFIPLGFKGAPDGVAELDSNGLVPASQLPALNATLPDSGVTPGTYKSVTVNSKGIVTAGTNPTTLAGYGITNAMSTSHPANNINAVAINKWNMIADQGIRINQGFAFNTGAGLVISDDYMGGEAGIYDANNNKLLAGKEDVYYKYGAEYGGDGGVVVNWQTGNISYGGHLPHSVYNHWFKGTVLIDGGIATEASSGNDVYGGSGAIYQLDKDISQEDGSLRLSVFDRVFTGFNNAFSTDKRIVKITLQNGGTLTMQNYFRYQEITVMNVGSTDASFIIDNTPVNVYIPVKASATLYINGQNKIILVRMDNDYCGVLN